MSSLWHHWVERRQVAQFTTKQWGVRRAERLAKHLTEQLNADLVRGVSWTRDDIKEFKQQQQRYLSSSESDTD